MKDIGYLQHGAGVKTVSAGSPFQGGEGHVPPVQRGDVAELLGAECHSLFISGAEKGPGRRAVGLTA